MSGRHFRSLLFKLARIHQQIDREYGSRRPDWLRLLRLKKLRLAIQDRWARFAANDRVSLRVQPALVGIHSSQPYSPAR